MLELVYHAAYHQAVLLNPMLCIHSTRLFLCCFFSMCAGKWAAAWDCVVALQGIRPLRTVYNALILTVDDLSSIVDGAVRGLAEVKEVLEHDRSQRHLHMSLSASA